MSFDKSVLLFEKIKKTQASSSLFLFIRLYTHLVSVQHLNYLYIYVE